MAFGSPLSLMRILSSWVQPRASFLRAVRALVTLFRSSDGSCPALLGRRSGAARAPLACRSGSGAVWEPVARRSGAHPALLERRSLRAGRGKAGRPLHRLMEVLHPSCWAALAPAEV